MGPSPPTAYRSRKKRRPEQSTSTGTVILDSSKTQKPAFPLVAFFWPAKGTNTSQWITLPVILIWMLGRIGWLIEPEWFRLYLSRGTDDAGLKVFMRATVVVSEFLIYIPGAVLCVRQLARLHNINAWESSIALTALLMQPATILIDHGHFQYNTVMLGFTLAAIASMLAGRPLWSCVFFVGALGFKQMALFYALAVAAYLAGICFSPRLDVPRLLAIAIVTLASFAVLFLPLLIGTAYDTYRNVPLPSDATIPPLLSSLPWQTSEKAWYYPYLIQLAQAIHRIFPFSRGLFEDKVANLWCAIHTSGLHKLHNYDSALLSRAALGLTLASITPPCALLFFLPKKAMIPYAFAATAWGFFLCSYQVHEKNVLLPLLPMTLLLATDGGMKAATRAWVGFANLLACWTLFPLLVKDQLRIPYFVLTGLWAWFMGLPPLSFKAYTVSGEEGGLSIVSKVLHLGVYATMVAWHVVEAWVPPPNDKPDLWVVANVCLGAAGFGLCYLWCLWRLVEESGLLSGKGPAKRGGEVSKKKQ
ncbi:Glucosyltransferase-like protein [Friedmanniomyces endolithicus]|uniref:Alpha-1,3-glucosyltransferase n=1 Tax=Friedmanniomyces endolithicus TaxID=329885 RepID=A0AAN6FEG5_9PEZI|nr:Glucosyltransferase-like protein [Friedmanniomyces endolithicus]